MKLNIKKGTISNIEDLKHFDQKEGMEKMMDRLLYHWILCHDYYADVMSYDNQTTDAEGAYYYNELTNNSILSSAAWMAGFASVTEPKVVKLSQDEGWSNGNLDIYIAQKRNEPLNDPGLSLWIEAKVAFPTIEDQEIKDTDIIVNAWNAALSASKMPWEASNRAAALFICPKFAKAAEIEDKAIQTVLEKCLHLFSNEENLHVAWVFPQNSRQLYCPAAQRKFPGVFVLVKRL